MQAYCAEVCWPFGCGMAPLVAADRPVPALCMYRANIQQVDYGGGINTTLLIPKPLEIQLRLKSCVSSTSEVKTLQGKMQDSEKVLIAGNHTQGTSLSCWVLI